MHVRIGVGFSQVDSFPIGVADSGACDVGAIDQTLEHLVALCQVDTPETVQAAITAQSVLCQRPVYRSPKRPQSRYFVFKRTQDRLNYCRTTVYPFSFLIWLVYRVHSGFITAHDFVCVVTLGVVCVVLVMFVVLLPKPYSPSLKQPFFLFKSIISHYPCVRQLPRM